MNEPIAVIVIPCYNEYGRLAIEKFVNFAQEHGNIRFIFVDDGSTDGTEELIKPYCGARIQLHTLTRNSGKAEAVRQGILRALEQEPSRIGFWDADLSTPLRTICSFHETMEQNRNLDMVIGFRVCRLGADIKRNAGRHIIGRILMTVLYSLLDFTVYDSQCGAKMMTAEAARAITGEPFHTRWLFDLEMLVRLQRFRRTDLHAEVYEYPLEEWHEIGRSKVRIGAVMKDVIRFFRYYKGEKKHNGFFR